jgi:hypothetical protein
MGEARRRKGFGKTQAAIKTRQDWAGIFVEEQVELLLAPMNQESQALLRPCIPHIANAAEMLCPAAILPTPDGIAFGYGPQQLAAGAMLVIVASPKRAVMLSMQEWPELPPVPDDIDPRSVWLVLADLIDGPHCENTAEYLGNAITLRLGDAGRAGVAERARTIRANGHTPALVALAAARDAGIGDDMRYAAGGMAMLALPPSLETQLGMSAELRAQ